MLLSNSNYITFDLTEIIAELEIPNKGYTPLKPLQTGNQVPDFILKKENINNHKFLRESGDDGSILLRQIAGKPLVISFYSAEWQAYGLNHLKYLNTLHNEIKAIGGNLLVISPDDANAGLEGIVWDNSLKLNFYFDKDNLIAQKFKVFSDTDPSWNNYPGIEVNVPLLATYVIDQFNRVIFHHVDHQLQGSGSSVEILQAIQGNDFYKQNKKSA